jgi:hypothetical protein
LFQPPSELANVMRNQNGQDAKINFLHGTTTLAFKYNGGVIIAVDSRATGGMYIFSGNVKKIIPINQYLMGTMAGGAADCMYWERVLSKQCRLYELRNKQRISVAAASKLLSNICFEYKGMEFFLLIMIIIDNLGFHFRYLSIITQNLKNAPFWHKCQPTKNLSIYHHNTTNFEKFCLCFTKQKRFSKIFFFKLYLQIAQKGSKSSIFARKSPF